MQDHTIKTVYSVPGLAKVAGKSPDTIRKLVEAGKLKATNDSCGNLRPRWSILWADYLEYRDRHSNRQPSQSQALRLPSKPRRQHI